MLDFIQIAPGCPYFGFEPTLDLTCEEGLCHWIRQPANTLSSLIFFFPAFLVFQRAKNEGSATFKALGIIFFLIGLASLTAHATHLRLFGFADFSFQYLLIFSLLWINLYRLKLNPSKNLWPFSLSLWAIVAIFQWNFPQHSLIYYGVLFIFLLFSELVCHLKKPHFQYQNYAKCAGLLGLGGIAFYLDFQGIFCDPNNHIFQLHAAWHFLASASLFYLVRHYRQFI